MGVQQGLEALGAPGLGTAARHDRAYVLDLLGDSLSGLGRHEEAIDAYREAAQGFETQGAPCSHALCLCRAELDRARLLGPVSRSAPPPQAARSTL